MSALENLERSHEYHVDFQRGHIDFLNIVGAGLWHPKWHRTMMMSNAVNAVTNPLPQPPPLPVFAVVDDLVSKTATSH